METNFKFEIGQVVYLKQDILNKHFSKDGIPELLVIERHLQECYSGIQNYYYFRSFTSNGPNIVSYFEIELTDKVD